MNRPNALRHQFVLWGLLLGLWGFLVLIFAGQLVFTDQLPWTQALFRSLHEWIPWALLAPLVAWLAVKFPLERQRLWLSIPVHAVACILALGVYELLAQPLGPPPSTLGPGPRNRFQPGPLPPRGPEGRPGSEQLPPGPPPDAIGAPRYALPGARAPFANSLIRRSRFNIPIYWVIVSIVHALTYYRSSQERQHHALELEARLAEAKLNALRLQLHPHFLFNTLNAISTLVHKDPSAADEMIANLSELLRATLDAAEQEIPLQQELSFLDRYLEIQQTRFGERLRVEKRIDIAALEARVPTLILQPLVENALRHGLEPNPAPGLIIIEANRAGDALLLAVRDNGAGVKAPTKSSEGIGLANTRARLHELYGNAARLVLHSGPEGGCSVELELPYCAGACRARPETTA